MHRFSDAIGLVSFWVGFPQRHWMMVSQISLLLVGALYPYLVHNYLCMEGINKLYHILIFDLCQGYMIKNKLLFFFGTHFTLMLMISISRAD